MRLVWKVLILTSVTAWYLNEPIPKHFSQPWRLRGLLASMTLTMDTSWLLEQIGLLSQIDAMNALVTYTVKSEFPGFDMNTISETTMAGVDVRVYQPLGGRTEADSAVLPAMVYFHGGGWVIGSAKMQDTMLIPVVKRMNNLLIVSVDYRLAPKNLFPAGLNDCLAVTKYFISNADKFGVDPTRIAVAGDSAGGNFAAAVTLMLRDEKFTQMPKLQLLVYPVLQAVDYSLPSQIQNGDGPLVKRYWMAYYHEVYAYGKSRHASVIAKSQHVSPEARKQLYNKYLRHENLEINYHYQPYQKPSLDSGDAEVWNDLKGVFLNPLFSPLLAEDLSDLPEAYIYTPMYDLLRDDGVLYSQRLQQAGVPTTHILGTNTFHGICNYLEMFPEEAMDCIGTFVEFLEKL